MQQLRAAPPGAVRHHHLHTGLSFDASIRFVDYQAGNSPRRAYRFAQGKATIQLPDPSGAQRPGAPIGGGPSRTPKIGSLAIYWMLERVAGL